MCFFLQAEDGIRDLVRSRGLGDVYKRQGAEIGVVHARGLDAARHEAARRIPGDAALGVGQGLSLIHI